MKRLMDGIIRFLDEFQQNCSGYVDRIKFILYAVFAWYLATFSEVIPTFRIISIVFVVSMVIGTIVGINIKGVTIHAPVKVRPVDTRDVGTLCQFQSTHP